MKCYACLFAGDAAMEEWLVVLPGEMHDDIAARSEMHGNVRLAKAALFK